MSTEPSPRHRYLQDVGNIDPAALPQRFRAPEAHDHADDDDAQGATAADAPEPTEPKAALTSGQAYRVRLAESNLRAIRSAEFLDMSSADQVLWFDRLRRDSEDLLKIIRATTEES